jgi:hypothetical protein
MFGVMKRNSRTAWALLVGMSLSACEQVPGEGGRASIVGHVQEEARTVLTQPSAAPPYPAADHNVFLIYGNNVGPDDNVETNHEGDFVFPWLRPGEYTVYVYSEDTSGTVPPRDMAVLRTVTVENQTETVVLDTLTVYKDL